MRKLNQFISGDDGERGESFLDDESDDLCSLSPAQRMYAFAACLVAGLACTFLSLIVFVKPIKFAVLFTFGNVLAVGSTVFLIGVGKQLSVMFDSVRIYATAIYIGFVVISLICALWNRKSVQNILEGIENFSSRESENRGKKNLNLLFSILY
ncbi:vesicle transport protein SFT2B isoform X2 [Manihot esculenta]|uniref:vesicle transport protein SFT2B isoform X2 n=1 Tax=Manihot esculenta TaxID=3983 RepID=UPI000B5D87DA|nr:vesicle transport protein SFT2B isoform X2 [Manihot esculenta]